MDDLSEHSSNTLVAANGGKPADGVPADGTGKEHSTYRHCFEPQADIP